MIIIQKSFFEYERFEYFFTIKIPVKTVDKMIILIRASSDTVFRL